MVVELSRPQAVRRAASRAELIAGSRMATKMAMIPMTTNNSISVNPRFKAYIGPPFLLVISLKVRASINSHPFDRVTLICLCTKIREQ